MVKNEATRENTAPPAGLGPLRGSAQYVDHLAYTPPPSGYRYCIMSFVSPTSRQKSKLQGVKIYEVFRTVEEAQKYNAEVLEHDPDARLFDRFVADLGAWLKWNPDPSDVQTEVYSEELLNKMMEEYKDNRKKVKEYFIEDVRRRIERTREQGMREAQEQKAQEREHPVSVRARIIRLEEEERHLLEKLETTRRSLKESQALYGGGQYTAEELAAAEDRIADIRKRMDACETEEDIDRLYQYLNATSGVKQPGAGADDDDDNGHRDGNDDDDDRCAGAAGTGADDPAQGVAA